MGSFSAPHEHGDGINGLFEQFHTEVSTAFGTIPIGFVKLLSKVKDIETTLAKVGWTGEYPEGYESDEELDRESVAGRIYERFASTGKDSKDMVWLVAKLATKEAACKALARRVAERMIMIKEEAHEAQESIMNIPSKEAMDMTGTIQQTGNTSQTSQQVATSGAPNSVEGVANSTASHDTSLQKRMLSQENSPQSSGQPLQPTSVFVNARHPSPFEFALSEQKRMLSAMATDPKKQHYQAASSAFGRHAPRHSRNPSFSATENSANGATNEASLGHPVLSSQTQQPFAPSVYGAASISQQTQSITNGYNYGAFQNQIPAGLYSGRPFSGFTESAQHAVGGQYFSRPQSPSPQQSQQATGKQQLYGNASQNLFGHPHSLQNQQPQQVPANAFRFAGHPFSFGSLPPQQAFPSNISGASPFGLLQHPQLATTAQSNFGGMPNQTAANSLFGNPQITLYQEWENFLKERHGLGASSRSQATAVPSAATTPSPSPLAKPNIPPSFVFGKDSATLAKSSTAEISKDLDTPSCSIFGKGPAPTIESVTVETPKTVDNPTKDGSDKAGAAEPISINADGQKKAESTNAEAQPAANPVVEESSKAGPVKADSKAPADSTAEKVRTSEVSATDEPVQGKPVGFSGAQKLALLIESERRKASTNGKGPALSGLSSNSTLYSSRTLRSHGAAATASPSKPSSSSEYRNPPSGAPAGPKQWIGLNFPELVRYNILSAFPEKPGYVKMCRVTDNKLEWVFLQNQEISRRMKCRLCVYCSSANHGIEFCPVRQSLSTYAQSRLRSGKSPTNSKRPAPESAEMPPAKR